MLPEVRKIFILTTCSARMNSVMFSTLWICAPICVSVISFYVYVAQGKELTVSIAFTVSAVLAEPYVEILIVFLVDCSIQHDEVRVEKAAPNVF